MRTRRRDKKKKYIEIEEDKKTHRDVTAVEGEMSCCFYRHKKRKKRKMKKKIPFDFVSTQREIIAECAHIRSTTKKRSGAIRI